MFDLRRRVGVTWMGLLVSLLFLGEAAIAQAPTDPGNAHANIHAGIMSLSNGVMTARWSVTGNRFAGLDLAFQQRSVPLPHNSFSLIFKDGSSLLASEMNLASGPQVEVVPANEHAGRAADRFAGQSLVLRLEDRQGRVAITWRAILRDDSNYFREEVSVSALGDDQPVQELRLFDSALPGAQVVGSVKGSPVVAGDLFLGFEHPLSQCEAHQNVICGIKRELPLKSGQTVRYSLVLGVAEPGQMRRSFLAYLERERPRSYQPFLHYNTWYDIGFGKPYSAVDVLDVIRSFGTELVSKRGVKLSSVLLDDGWDNPDSLWTFNSGFPHGIAPLISTARQYGAGIGIWMSPWGGYEEAKQKRLANGRRNGYEINEGGFALSGPKYYARFHEVSSAFIRDGVNQFKIDGTGNVNSVFPGSSFDSDFAAAIALIQDWRALKPDLYVNLTTGTYPSPFWLLNADSIWRGGEDHSFAGVGSWREKWITYRDQHTYHGIVQAGPLFPLNSLMLHGLIYARQAEHLESDPGHDFANEVHDYFGTGTQLQEMYISHALLSPEDWDVLAEAANWSRRNADVLIDTHWVGGDPGKLEVYGWAAWSPKKSIITLRNPSDHEQSFALDVGSALELPPNAGKRFSAHSPWKRDQKAASISLAAGQKHTFLLKPFAVVNLELSPVH
ncbi:MAG TPA: enterotoxin [Terriglobales bacterium]